LYDRTRVRALQEAQSEDALRGAAPKTRKTGGKRARNTTNGESAAKQNAQNESGDRSTGGQELLF